MINIKEIVRTALLDETVWDWKKEFALADKATGKIKRGISRTTDDEVVNPRLSGTEGSYKAEKFTTGRVIRGKSYGNQPEDDDFEKSDFNDKEEKVKAAVVPGAPRGRGRPAGSLGVVARSTKSIGTAGKELHNILFDKVKHKLPQIGPGVTKRQIKFKEPVSEATEEQMPNWCHDCGHVANYNESNDMCTNCGGMNVGDIPDEDKIHEATHILHTVDRHGKPNVKIKLNAIDNRNANFQAKRILGSKPYRGIAIDRIERIHESKMKDFQYELGQHIDPHIDAHLAGKMDAEVLLHHVESGKKKIASALGHKPSTISSLVNDHVDNRLAEEIELDEADLHGATKEFQKHLRITNGDKKSALGRLHKANPGKTFIAHPNDDKIIRVLESTEDIYGIEEGLARKLGAAVLGTTLAVGAAMSPGQAASVTSPEDKVHRIINKKPLVKSTGSFEVNGKTYNTYFPKLAYPADDK